jgi:putative regulator of septum formation
MRRLIAVAAGQGASDYLGGDWHGATVGLGLVLPSAGAWTGGARWFRCDLLHYSDPDATSVIDHGTLRGDLAGPHTAAYGSLAVTTDGGRKHILTSKPIGCDQPHGAEFAGTYTAPDVPWPSDDTRRETMLSQGCEGVVAHFLGYSAISQWHNDKVGWWELPWDETQRALGDRTTQCFAFAYTSSGTVVGSVKGIRDQTPNG